MDSIAIIFFIVIYLTVFASFPSRSGGRRIPMPPDSLRKKMKKK
jgi:signal recognition particle subunit SEC65